MEYYAVTSSNITTMLSIPDDVESESGSKSFIEKDVWEENKRK